MNQTTQKNPKNLRLVFLFVGLVAVLIILSLLVKIFVLLGQSKFDSSHQYIVAIVKDPTTTDVISFSPQDKSISKIEITGSSNPKQIAKSLGIILDAFLVQRHPTARSKEDISGELEGNFLSSSSKNLGVVDTIKLILFAKSVPGRMITIQQIHLPSPQVDIDRISAGLFTDSSLVSENASIQVVNASTVSGLGSYVAKILTNLGANVISVSTGDATQHISQIIVYKKMPYTIDRMSALFGYPVINASTDGEGEVIYKGDTIADIVIVVGNDGLSRVNY